MDITSLTVVLGVVVIVAASVLTASNEPPLWVYLLTGAGSLPLSHALLGTHCLSSTVGDSGVAPWVVRLAVIGTLTAALSFFVGGDGRGRAVEGRTGPRGSPRGGRP
ncbi:hypothetical protein ACFV4T_41165 [Streptomyces sp. NPDC059755]|uniref:hypothetical protein n=1 Tax=unclassified Streptomyces TaxID=2593676 RepID=UPI0006CC4C31|nr:hypothetical protein OV320_6400 [Actinobacteria bacterium OV320]